MKKIILLNPIKIFNPQTSLLLMKSTLKRDSMRDENCVKKEYFQ